MLVGTGLLSAGAATASFTRATAQTPVATTFEPVLAFRTYIVLGSMDEIRLQLALLTHHMEGQPGLLDYRVAELGDSTLAVISSFLGQEASDAAAEVEAERQDLNFRIRCDTYIGVTGIVAAALPSLESVLQTQSAWSSVAHTLLCGAVVWTAAKLREHGPALRKLREKDADLARGAGFSIKTFYKT